MYATTELLRKAPTTLSTNGILKAGILGFLCVSSWSQCSVDNAAGAERDGIMAAGTASAVIDVLPCQGAPSWLTPGLGAGREQPEWQKRSDRDVFVVH